MTIFGQKTPMLAKNGLFWVKIGQNGDLIYPYRPENFVGPKMAYIGPVIIFLARTGGYSHQYWLFRGPKLAIFGPRNSQYWWLYHPVRAKNFMRSPL